MSLIFTTQRNSGYDVEIGGVGRLAGNGQGGIPVEHAAKVVAELQDDKGEPLSGAKLEKAAEEFAEARGLTTKSLKNIDQEKLRVEAGAFPIGLTIEEISANYASAQQAQVEAHQASGAPLTPADLPVQETSVLPGMPQDNPS